MKRLTPEQLEALQAIRAVRQARRALAVSRAKMLRSRRLVRKGRRLADWVGLWLD